VRANSRASTLSRTTPSAPASTKTPAQTSTPSQAGKPTSSRPERPHSGTVAVLDRLEEAQARRVKERSEWVRKTEERRLDKLKAYTVAEEIQNLGQKQAALVEKMIQDLFTLTPEWEIRRMKARAVSIRLFRLIAKYSSAFIPLVVQSQSRQCESTLDSACRRRESQDRANSVRVTRPIFLFLYIPPALSNNRFHTILKHCVLARRGRIYACRLRTITYPLFSLHPSLQLPLSALSRSHRSFLSRSSRISVRSCIYVLVR